MVSLLIVNKSVVDVSYFWSPMAENEQVSGSIKARAAFNRVILMAAEGVKTVYVASSGNLALAAVSNRTPRTNHCSPKHSKLTFYPHLVTPNNT